MGNWGSRYEQEPIFNRRSGPDWIQKGMLWLAILCWLLFIIAIVLFHYARPETQFGYLRFLHIEVRDYWKADLTEILITLLWCCCGLSLVTMLLNHRRSRRASDNRWYNLVLLMLISGASLLIYFYFN